LSSRPAFARHHHHLEQRDVARRFGDRLFSSVESVLLDIFDPMSTDTELQPRQKFAPSPAARARKRDQQVRRLTVRYEKLSGTAEPRLRPAFRNLAIITLMLERAYSTLRDRESLLNSDGELCSSLDAVRRLASTQSDLLRTCGLTAASISERGDRSLDAVFERISKVRKVREVAGDDEQKPAA
jgi:hypothetical protein